MPRKLIYEYRSDGTYMPSYVYCKVYNDGLLIAGDGDLWPPEEKIKINITHLQSYQGQQSVISSVS